MVLMRRIKKKSIFSSYFSKYIVLFWCFLKTAIAEISVFYIFCLFQEKKTKSNVFFLFSLFFRIENSFKKYETNKI